MSANRIKKLRNQNLYTQEDLKKLLENIGISINRATIAKYENGSRIPTDKIWQGLAETFNVPINYVKGTDLRSKTTEQKILELLVTTYYDNNDKYFNDLHIAITNWLLIKGGKNTADTLSKEQSLINGYASLFWKEIFSFLFTKKFIEDSSNLEYLIFVRSISTCIHSYIAENEIKHNFVLTHHKLDSKMMTQFYANDTLSTFIPALDKYINFLIQTKKEYLKHGYKK